MKDWRSRRIFNLFNPYTAERLKKYGLRKEVIDIIWEGCELEDIESLIPERLFPKIAELKEKVVRNISRIQRPELPTEKIIE